MQAGGRRELIIPPALGLRRPVTGFGHRGQRHAGLHRRPVEDQLTAARASQSEPVAASRARAAAIDSGTVTSPSTTARRRGGSEPAAGRPPPEDPRQRTGDEQVGTDVQADQQGEGMRRHPCGQQSRRRQVVDDHRRGGRHHRGPHRVEVREQGGRSRPGPAQGAQGGGDPEQPDQYRHPQDVEDVVGPLPAGPPAGPRRPPRRSRPPAGPVTGATSTTTVTATTATAPSPDRQRRPVGPADRCRPGGAERSDRRSAAATIPPVSTTAPAQGSTMWPKN